MLGAILPVLVCITALLLDRLFGEPRLHPLVLFGNTAAWLEKRLNTRKSRKKGVLAMVIVVGIPVAVLAILQFALAGTIFHPLLDIVILTFVIGWQSMKQHAVAVSGSLLGGYLSASRAKLAMIVSRDTQDLNERQVVGSTIESVLENGHDCLFASLFWYALLGPAGALLHRLVNTLDAMWGYKNERYVEFGFFAARFDDVLGYLPARLTAISYMLCGSSKLALQSWRDQIGNHKSPNAGLVMATGAGALGIVIGGPVHYGGKLQEKPYLGLGRPAQASDISRSIRLIEKALLVWLIVYALIVFGLYLVSAQP
jgi:adenosylcobinamide-phosphate synthase